MAEFRNIEDLVVYQRLCHLHLDVAALSYAWPSEEKYELGSQIRRASNSSPAQLAEKNDDRHVRNRIEGINRSRGEAGNRLTIFTWRICAAMNPRKPISPSANATANVFDAERHGTLFWKTSPESDRRWPTHEGGR